MVGAAVLVPPVGAGETGADVGVDAVVEARATGAGLLRIYCCVNSANPVDGVYEPRSTP